MLNLPCSKIVMSSTDLTSFRGFEKECQRYTSTKKTTSNILRFSNIYTGPTQFTNVLITNGPKDFLHTDW